MQSRGVWAALGNLQFYKTYDPVILFFGFGGQYSFEREVDGHTVQPGFRVTYNAGLSFALSEYTTLGYQISGAIEQPLIVDKTALPQQPNEYFRSRFAVIQRLDTDLYLEPSVTTGLYNAGDLTFGITLRKRF